MSTGSIDKFFAYEKLDDILLATDDGWLKSDPRVIQQWVEDLDFFSRFQFISLHKSLTQR
jgi:hypothetical protein